MCSGMRCGTYSPITSGMSAPPVSSTRSNSIELRSTTQCSPLTRLAYGLVPGPALTQLSDQPSRRSRYSGGATALPYVQVSKNTRSISETPRLARAAMTSGWLRSSWSHSTNSSTVKLACTPGMCSNDSTRSSVSDTLLLYVALLERWRQVTSARRAGCGPPSSNARSSALPGSASSMAANRHPSPTPCSRRRIDATAVNSSSLSGSSGYATRLRNHIPAMLRSDFHPGDGFSGRPARTLPRLGGGRRAGRIRSGACYRKP